MNDFLIEQVGKDALDQQIAVYARSFGGFEESADLKSRWIQKHYRNPVGDSIIFGAFSDGKMVGINAFMPMEYRLNDRVLKVLQSCESGVDPNFRRRGIWAAIIRRAMEYFSAETSYDAMIGFPNYHNSYPGFLKLGWKTVLSLSNLLMINSGQTVAEQYLPKPFSLIGNVAAVQKIPVKLIAGAPEHYTAELTCDIPSTRPVPNGAVSLNFTRDWISWKMSYRDLKNYAINRDGKKVADFIFQESGVNAFQYLKFIEGFSYADKKTYRAAFASCLCSFFQRKNIALIRLMCANPSQYRGLGFVKARLQHNPFIVYPLKAEWKNALLNPSAWNIGPLDLD